jgi:hypothetical protein
VPLTWKDTDYRDQYRFRGRNTRQVKAIGVGKSQVGTRRRGSAKQARRTKRQRVRMAGSGGSDVRAVEWSQGLSVRVGSPGTVAHAGIILPRLLGDRVGLTRALAAVVARAGFTPIRDRGRALVDAVAALTAGARCLSDIEAMTAQTEIFGPAGGASDTTLLRVLDELSGCLNVHGLPGRRLSTAMAQARKKAWAYVIDRHGQLPAVKVAGKDLVRAGTDGQPDHPIVVLRIDATLIGADSPKDGCAGNYKGGYGFHPMGAWCTNIGDCLAIMLRPGNAGAFTAADHLLVFDAAIAQIRRTVAP